MLFFEIKNTQTWSLSMARRLSSTLVSALPFALWFYWTELFVYEDEAIVLAVNTPVINQTRPRRVRGGGGGYSNILSG